MSKAKSKILIVGGHMTPAIAVVNELKKRGYNSFVWVGHKYNQAGNKELSPEFRTVEKLGIKFIELKTGKLVRKWLPETFLNGIWQFILIPLGFLKALIILLKERPKLVFSFGGYLAVPLVIWARILRIKVVTHEQTIITGLANKIIGFFSNKIFVSWETSLKYFPKHKTILTGNPIRREVFHIKSESLTKDFEKSLPILLVYGGNQGSHEVNTRIFEVLPKLLRECNIIHQTGNSSVTGDYQEALNLRKQLPANLQQRYTIKDYIYAEEVGEALQKANIIFGRSGANNITEFLALGKMAILMPIPWTSHDEATKNAEYYASTGLGLVLTQSSLITGETVLKSILKALELINENKAFDGSKLEKSIERAKSLVILDAPKQIADEVEKCFA